MKIYIYTFQKYMLINTFHMYVDDHATLATYIYAYTYVCTYIHTYMYLAGENAEHDESKQHP